MNEIYEQQTTSKEERKRMILAVILSTVIVSVGFIVQSVLFPPATQQQTTQGSDQAGANEQAIQQEPSSASPAKALPSIIPISSGSSPTADIIPIPAAEEHHIIETDVVRATFTNAGGELVSLTLKKHKDLRDSRGGVDMVVAGSQGADGLSVSFGQSSAPMRELMNAQYLDDSKKTIAFSRMFEAKMAGSDEKVPFIFKKVFSFRDGEYLFGLAISIEQPEGKPIFLGTNGVAYRIDLGPQIGPRFDQMPKNADYRKYIAEIDGKKKKQNLKANTSDTIAPNASWVALSGKYFTFIAIPQAPISAYEIATAQDPLINQTNSLGLLRSTFSGSSTTDTYYFYFGPKTSAELGKYEYADKNGFGLSNLNLEDAMEGSGILGWLETILKFLLNVFYRLIPNYGIAIILVTVLIKLLFYPLTKKGSLATARMSELQPKMQELQAKYKNNPQKLNQEMAELYKREHYNPMSGCLPMLIQFPLFIAMYNLFNNHFELRGAMFIPGWINDLSLPESLVNFGNFRIPLLGWNDLRALPIIYLFSQLMYGKFTQAPQSTQGNNPQANQMKLMMYGMPIMFFFILYDVPAGLLIYWITNNILTIAQQILINNLMKKRKMAGAAAQAAEGTPAAGAANAGPRLATGKSSAVDTKAKTVGRVPAKEGFSERVTNWLEKQAGEAEKASGSAYTKKKDQGRTSGSDRSSAPRKNKAKK
ncbi:MAG TPA: membrane protein insertase YidC [Rectinema sp.]|jgi:YidC/Oxa1 family membrane protein insertase|nr:membrane protein insertase YidC [Spirochaetota bacterium]HNP93145.1 membrane protein insertase YidC [Rectinema sp.]HNT59039.1 membrane protein insertase YidC [Rectinema sp.]HOC27117.1 membrane protein insertase YidC [Rectinema sp.]HOI98480.1 membrane protein insertase YidC [Rectinema sp.]